VDTEKLEYVAKYDFTADVLRHLEMDPLVTALKSFLSPRLYHLQLWQYSLSKRCESQRVEDELNQEICEVVYHRVQNDNNDERELIPSTTRHYVTIGERLSCNCSYYNRIGLVCLHIFHICNCKNLKNLNRLTIMDRWRRSLDSNEIAHFGVLPTEEEIIEEPVMISINRTEPSDESEIRSQKNEESKDFNDGEEGTMIIFRKKGSGKVLFIYPFII